MRAFIKCISYYLPDYVLTNEELNRQHPEWAIEKIAAKTGIMQRHIAAENEYGSDMAVAAVTKLFDEHKNISRTDIDFILYCTQSPDYFLPTTACILQQKLGIPTTAGALDFNLGCSGYVYGLAVAKGLVCAGIAKNILLITSETYSKYIDPADKSNKTIFGDAAAATIISTEGFSEIKEFSLGTDGRGAGNLMVKEGGARFPLNKTGEALACTDSKTQAPCLYMNGPEIFSFTSTAVPLLVEDIFHKNGLSLQEINLFVFHQANRFMLEHLRKKIGIPEEKFFLWLENCGNTVSCTIPIALKEAMNENKTKGNIVLAGFGVGYSWGGVVLSF